MTANSRVDRGRASQEIIAARLRDIGMVYAQSRPASLGGSDIMNWPGVYAEVKATEKCLPGSWTRETAAKADRQRVSRLDRGPLPFVVYRPRGFGPSNLDEWPVLVRWIDWQERVLRPLGHLTA